ncbi:hypothetical protein T4B_12249 [Trichinella pseudospiralis]|uniref:Uncharacterized protein n=1 Tax=Trichinella pseudospiralis TaxID=6337 RepID=A0A0V1INV8_TRIPS|nr:hypothetical protein T4B_12249 [Trichinella pseudospiralis]KRZ31071.1 hypothetical protein T4C_11606 [Trichinella pseudospiralis]
MDKKKSLPEISDGYNLSNEFDSIATHSFSMLFENFSSNMNGNKRNEEDADIGINMQYAAITLFHDEISCTRPSLSHY